VSVPGQSRLHRGPQLPYQLLAGVVPVPGGWLVASGKLVGIQVHPEEPRLVSRFRDVLDNIPGYVVVAVTVPIGLPTKAARGKHGGRAADHDARQLLGFPHAGAIGSTPTREALVSTAYEEARRRNGGLLDVVTWQLFPKIREVDDDMQPYLQRTVYEVRPELSFLQLNEDVPMKFGKDSKRGQRERQELLLRRLPGSDRIIEAELPRVSLAHRTDAAATLWTARRVAARAVSRLPEDPQWDDKGLRMEIVR
jgi:predicted RNase H-like nuclease